MVNERISSFFFFKGDSRDVYLRLESRGVLKTLNCTGELVKMG